ncbi:unnamed protein product [Rhizophagus irregularis]|nr:unnamed protein product [Rhizophagus irregularis]
MKIQYSINGSGGIIQIKDCPFFGGMSVKKDQRTCQGIKFCEFTDQELVNQEHCSVDFDSEIFQLYMQKTDENTKEAKTYINNIHCDGGPRIGRITDYQTNVISYFIGCNKYQKNERWHQFIRVKPDEIDISLLQNLFAGFIPE